MIISQTLEPPKYDNPGRDQVKLEFGKNITWHYNKNYLRISLITNG